MSKKLTDKQRAFALEYPKDFNATQAAIRAGYSPKTARQAGYKNMMKVDILADIEEAFKTRAMSLDEVLSRLTNMARGLEPSKISDGKAVYDALAALHLMAKYHGLLKERIEQTVKDEHEVILRVVRDEAESYTSPQLDTNVEDNPL